MENYTIYSDGIWERMLEKYPKLKELAIECNCVENPQKAKEISKQYSHGFGIGRLSDVEQKLGLELVSIEFREEFFLEQVVLTGKAHYKNGAYDYIGPSLNLVMVDFEDSFHDWYQEIKKRNISETASFAELYEVFLEIIKLKLDYQVPYTKLFIRKLLEMSAMPKEDALEMKNYFLEANPTILPEISCELIE